MTKDRLDRMLATKNKGTNKTRKSRRLVNVLQGDGVHRVTLDRCCGTIFRGPASLSLKAGPRPEQHK